MAPGIGRVTVARCDRSSLAPRVKDGDVTGDGIADVVGIQAGTGALYSYRMTSAGLTGDTSRGTGWGTTTWIQQVTELEGAGNGNHLVAVRSDGSLWSYQRTSTGGLQSGRELGHGFGGYTNFVVTQLNNNQFFGEHVLLASKGDVLYGWLLGPSLQTTGQLATGWSTTVKALSLCDFDGDNSDELLTIRKDGTMWVHDFDEREGYPSPLLAPRQVGSGWNAMQTVAAPGSFNGDGLTDLVARRSDGNLYRYTNTGGRWSAAVKVGQNWKGIRLLA